MPAYLKLGDIKGDVQDARYKDWIAIESMQFGTNSLRPTGLGNGREREGRDKQFFRDISISMRSSSVSPKLMEATAKGRTFAPVIIVLDDGQPDGARGFKLENVMISSYQVGGSKGGDVPMDAFTLNTTSITVVTGAELKALLAVPVAPQGRRR
jgi:type VI secretion system secreted protein Hcp